jgi:hypothetical protein
MAISRSKKESASTTVSSAQKLEAVNNAKVAESAKAMVQNSAEVIRSLTETKLQLSANLDGIATAIAERVKNLSELEEAIRIQSELLQSTYAIKSEADTLDRIKAEIEQAKIARQEDAEEIERLRRREEDEYEYNRKLKRQEEDNLWLRRAQVREAELAKRETAIAESLADLSMWKSKYEGMPSEIESRVKAEVASIAGAIKRDSEATAKLAAKDAEMAKALAEQTIKGQAQRIAELEAQLADAKKALNDANARVQVIAEKAIEGASKQAPVVISSGTADNGRSK